MSCEHLKRFLSGDGFDDLPVLNHGERVKVRWEYFAKFVKMALCFLRESDQMCSCTGLYRVTIFAVDVFETI